MINVSNLTKCYGDLTAVNGISFTIKKGEITGLLGPNGAGKTTTLRMLTCYLKPNGGRVEIGNFTTEGNPMEVRSMIGYLPESVPLYGDMLVYDYLRFIGEVRGIAFDEKIAEIASLCGLEDVMHKNINELSKGYKQRVGLAHAMIHDPEILILDEPTSGLDPNQIVEIRNLIKEIGKKKTVILSTHILSEVEATCERVIIINRGNIVADSSVSDLKSSYRQESRVSIKVGGTDFAGLRQGLSAIGGISTIQEESNDEDLTGAVILTASGTEIRPDIFRAVSDNGWTLYEMKKETFTLEHIFRQLTTGGNA